MHNKRNVALVVTLLLLLPIAAAFYFLVPQEHQAEFTAMVVLAGAYAGVIASMNTQGDRILLTIGIVTAAAAAIPAVLTIAFNTNADLSRLWIISPLIWAILYIGLSMVLSKPNTASGDKTRRRKPQSATKRRKRALKEADQAFDAEIRHLLESATAGFPYGLPTTTEGEPDQTEQNATQLYEFMVAESYLVKVQGAYMVTASGRQYRVHLQRSTPKRWFDSNYQWLIVTVIAAASVIAAITSIIVAANS